MKTIQLVAVRNNSRIFRCSTAEGELAVKYCLDPTTGRPDPQGARFEFESLQQLTEASKAAGEVRLTPVPIGLLGESGILAMTWESGQPMTRALLSSFGNPQLARDCGAAAGDWLQRFHHLHLRPEQISNFQDKLHFVENELEVRGLKGDQLLQHTLVILNKLAARAEAVRLPVSWAYGDFKSDNLLVTGTQALALDVQLLNENSVIHNIVPFLVHLELLRWSPRGVLNWRGLTQAGESFLAAYSPTTRNWCLPIAWLQAEMLLQRSIGIARATSIAGRVRRAMIRKALARAVRRMDHA